MKRITESKRGEGDFAPVFYPLPTGIDINRVLVIGTLTECEDIGTDMPYLRGRVADPTGSINIYAGEYQPEAADALAQIETPAYIAVVGKPNIYTTEEGSAIVSLRPETITVVSSVERDMWIQSAAKATLNRIESLEEFEDREAYAIMCSNALESINE